MFKLEQRFLETKDDYFYLISLHLDMNQVQWLGYVGPAKSRGKSLWVNCNGYNMRLTLRMSLNVQRDVMAREVDYVKGLKM